MQSGKPIKNCFECTGGKEMKELCHLYEKASSQRLCGNRHVCDNDWIKYLNNNSITTFSGMLDEFIKKNKLEQIPIINVGKNLDLSSKIVQNVTKTISNVDSEILDKSRLVLLTFGDFKSEIQKTRDIGYRGPISIFSDDAHVKKYGTRMGADEICQTKEDIYKVILKYIA